MNNSLICVPVMLHTNNHFAPIWTGESGFLRVTPGGVQDSKYTQHLYLVSDREIKKDNWIWDKRDNWFGQADKPMHPDYIKENYRRVEATTDKSLNLPLIPHSFIQEYVDKQGKIDKVAIQLYHRGGKELVSAPYNEVIILPIKDSWNREELKTELKMAFAEGYLKAAQKYDPVETIHKVGTFDEWFDKIYPL